MDAQPADVSGQDVVAQDAVAPDAFAPDAVAQDAVVQDAVAQDAERIDAQPGDTETQDAIREDANPPDLGVDDAGGPSDAIVPPPFDAGGRDATVPPPFDAGGAPDATVPPPFDAGGRDATVPPPFDAGAPDFGTFDATVPPPFDAGAPDTGTFDATIPPVPDSGIPADTGTLDATIPPVPDSGIPADTGTLDAISPPDAEAPDSTEPDAEVADADAPDAEHPDASDAGVPFAQGGGVVITELAARSASEWIELHNTNATAVALETYSMTIDSHPIGALVIRAASDPTGTLGTPVPVAAGAYAVGVPNPANAADIPPNTAFVFGTPGQIQDAFADTGDLVLIESASADGDLLDFRTAVFDAATPIGPSDFPLPENATMSLDPSLDGAGGETANDDGGGWCADVFHGPTRGAANRPCDQFVISEFSYDYDSFTVGDDNGEEFVELAGPAGGSLTNLALTRIEGSSGSSAGNIDEEIPIIGGRMPLDGLFVIADDETAGSPTLVPNADQVVNLVMENGPDAIQLVRLGATPVLLDAVGYGTVTPTVDTTRGFAAREGTTVPDPNPTVYAIVFARSDGELDTNNNASDFRYDPSPTPGLRNGQSDFAFTSISPDNAGAGSGRTVSVLLTGVDFTDLMTLSFGQTPSPGVSCPVPAPPLAPNTLRCTLTYPAAGSGLAETVDVTLAARAESGGVSTLAGAFTWTTANNETDVPLECDFCDVHSPASFTVAAETESAPIFGQIFEAGSTDTTIGGPAPGIIADVGFGAAGSDPRTVNWTWFPAEFNAEAGPGGANDEFTGTIVAPATLGNYAFGYRYSLDGGLTWTYADLDGAGSNVGSTFELANLGVMTVN